MNNAFSVTNLGPLFCMFRAFKLKALLLSDNSSKQMFISKQQILFIDTPMKMQVLYNYLWLFYFFLDMKSVQSTDLDTFHFLC